MLMQKHNCSLQHSTSYCGPKTSTFKYSAFSRGQYFCCHFTRSELLSWFATPKIRTVLLCGLFSPEYGGSGFVRRADTPRATLQLSTHEILFDLDNGGEQGACQTVGCCDQLPTFSSCPSCQLRNTTQHKHRDQIHIADAKRPEPLLVHDQTFPLPTATIIILLCIHHI